LGNHTPAEEAKVLARRAQMLARSISDFATEHGQHPDLETYVLRLQDIEAGLGRLSANLKSGLPKGPAEVDQFLQTR